MLLSIGLYVGIYFLNQLPPTAINSPFYSLPSPKLAANSLGPNSTATFSNST
jgi:hypothetical protein